MNMNYGYSPYPWWHSPLQYETTYEIVEDEDGNKVKRRVRRAVPITENPPEGQEYGVFGGSLSGLLGKQCTRGMGDDDGYGVLSKKCRPYGSLSKRYKGNTGSLGATTSATAATATRGYTLWKYSRGIQTWRLEGAYATAEAAQMAVPALRRRYGPTVQLVIRTPSGASLRATGPTAPTARASMGDDGDYGTLSLTPDEYGSLSRRYQSGAGVLGVDPPPPSVVQPMSTGTKIVLVTAVVGLAWWLLKAPIDDSYTARRIASVRRLADATAAMPRRPSTAIVPYEDED